MSNKKELEYLIKVIYRKDMHTVLIHKGCLSVRMDISSSHHINDTIN